MGERKGQNHYYPPDFDPKKHRSLNGYHGVHPLRERARKMDQGILIIRFEAPWNFWCNKCGNHIERGVRYNADKKKVGNYYTTPIYSFRMNCHLCDNHFTFETDPKACDYKITEGARRKVETWDPADTEVIDVPDKEEKFKRDTDAMYRLQHEAADKERASKSQPALVQLFELKSQTSERDYDTNAYLRKVMRGLRKEYKQQKATDEELRSRIGFGIDLVEEAEEDIEVAKSITFSSKKRAVTSRDSRHALKAAKIFDRPSSEPRIENDPVKQVKAQLLKRVKQQLSNKSTHATSSALKSLKASSLKTPIKSIPQADGNGSELESESTMAPEGAKTVSITGNGLVAADYESSDSSEGEQ